MSSLVLAVACLAFAALAARRLIRMRRVGGAGPVPRILTSIALGTCLLWLALVALERATPGFFASEQARWILWCAGAGPFLLLAVWVAFLVPSDQLRKLGPVWDTAHIAAPQRLLRPVFVVETLTMAGLIGAAFAA